MPGIRRSNVIEGGYIPVEYNTYKELIKKANQHDAMMAALKDYNQKERNAKKQITTSGFNEIIYDDKRNHYFLDWGREVIVCNLKMAERYLNDLMTCRQEDISMYEVIHDVIEPSLWACMIKNEEISNKVFKYGDSNYISFGFDNKNISKFINKETDLLFMNFNCVNKEEEDDEF